MMQNHKEVSHYRQIHGSSQYRWINITMECNTCQYLKDNKICILGGVIRKLFTKGRIHKKCKPKLKNIVK
jgi:hypothetical protein